MTQKAIDKLTKELAEVKGGTGMVDVIKKDVQKTLISFCKQDEEFAQAIVQSDKTFGECCHEIVKGATLGISDIEAYRKAVQFYFPDAGIKMAMTINLCASVDGSSEDNMEAPAAPTPKHEINLRLTDFL